MTRLTLALLTLSAVAALAGLLLAGSLGRRQPAARAGDLVPAQFEDKALFLSPIKQAKDAPSRETVTGLIVPHHLLARDLMAAGYNFASRGKFESVLLISPDHFGLGETDVSVVEGGFATVFGELAADSATVKGLERLPFVRAASFAYREHGIGAELPFIKYFFPDVKVTAVTLKAAVTRRELDELVDDLKRMLKPDTLVIQSTDFSHSLTPGQADVRDRQTEKVLETGDAAGLLALDQPSNIDSAAAQYVQTRLQNEFFGSKFRLLDHGNSQDYAKEPVVSSTSYFVAAYVK